MADMKHLSRLFAMEPERAPVKVANLANLDLDVSGPSMLDMQTMFWQRPARRQFGRAKNAVDAPALASTMSATAPPDRSRDFAVLAMQDRIRALARHAGRDDHPQHAEVQIQL